MKQFLLLSLFFFPFVCLKAATITGTVTDDKGAPLGFASVSVKGGTKGAIANSQGRYSISIAEGTYILVCQHVGYQTEEKQVQLTGG